MHKQNFTLNEFVALCIMLGVLAYLLPKQLSSHRICSRNPQFACLANMNAIGKGVLLYADDYKRGDFPGDDMDGNSIGYATFASSTATISDFSPMIAAGYGEKRSLVCKMSDVIKETGSLDIGEKSVEVNSSYGYNAGLSLTSDPDTFVLWDMYYEHDTKKSKNMGGNYLSADGTARKLKKRNWIDMQKCNGL